MVWGMTGERVSVCRGSRSGSRGTGPRTEVSREELRASVDQTVRTSPHPGGSQLPTLPGLHSTTKTGDLLRDMVFLQSQKRNWTILI